MSFLDECRMEHERLSAEQAKKQSVRRAYKEWGTKKKKKAKPKARKRKNRKKPSWRRGLDKFQILRIHRARELGIPLYHRDYSAYLRSPFWQQKREAAFREYGRHCNRCGSLTSLQVHHKTYERLGCERIEDLEVLCETCHKLEHRAA